MCDFAGFFTCFESYTVPYILCTYLIFWGLIITQDMRVRSFIYIRIGDILILKNNAFLGGVPLPEVFTLQRNLCLKVYNGNLEDMLI